MDGDGRAKFIQNSATFEGRDVIQYTLFTETDGGRTEALVRFLDFEEVGDFQDFDGDTDGFDDFPIKALPTDFDVSQAINSIEYIYQNNLLELTEFVEPTTGLPGSPDIIFH